MFGFGHKNRLNVEEIERLIVALKRVEKPTLSSQGLLLMKSRLLAKIRKGQRFDPLPASYRKFAVNLKLIADKVVLPSMVAAMMKARVMAVVEERANLNRGSYNRYFRFATAVAMLLVFIVTALFTAPFKVPLTYAATYLDDISGDVLVWRDGMYLKAQQDLVLSEGDLVLTLKNSGVTIHFLDRSLGRLSGNTGVEIRRLFSDPQNPVLTKVELYLKEGKMLAKVNNLIDEQAQFMVKTDKVVANVSKKGAFDISEDANSTKIAVFDNMVDIKPSEVHGNVLGKTVLAGYSAEIKQNDLSAIAVKPMVKSDSEVIASTKWLEANDASVSSILAKSATADLIGVNELKLPPSSRDETGVVLNADVKAQREYFLGKVAELKKAEVMFARGNHKEGSRLLRSFRRGVSNILAAMPALEAKDQLVSSILKHIIKEQIAEQMKDMSVFLPGDNLYPVKESLQDVILLLADNRVEKIHLMISQAENKLLEIQELLNVNKAGYAGLLLNDYKDKMDQLVLTVAQVENQDILLDLVTQQIQQIKVMTAIESMLVGTANTDLLKSITVLRRETMMNLIASIQAIKDKLPQEVMLGLKDVFNTYLVDADDRAIFVPEFERLFGGVGGVNFIQPDGASVPDSVGMAGLVDLEATPDAESGN